MEAFTIFLLLLSQAFITQAADSQPTSTKLIDELLDSSLKIFSDLIFQKYASSSKLNVSDITHLWNNLVLQPNSSSRGNTHETNLSDQDLCNKLSNNSRLCLLSTKVHSLLRFSKQHFNSVEFFILLGFCSVYQHQSLQMLWINNS